MGMDMIRLRIVCSENSEIGYDIPMQKSSVVTRVMCGHPGSFVVTRDLLWSLVCTFKQDPRDPTRNLGRQAFQFRPLVKVQLHKSYSCSTVKSAR